MHVTCKGSSHVRHSTVLGDVCCLPWVPSLVNNRRAPWTHFSQWHRLIGTEMRHAVEMTAWRIDLESENYLRLVHFQRNISVWHKQHYGTRTNSRATASERKPKDCLSLAFIIDECAKGGWSQRFWSLLSQWKSCLSVCLWPKSNSQPQNNAVFPLRYDGSSPESSKGSGSLSALLRLHEAAHPGRAQSVESPGHSQLLTRYLTQRSAQHSTSQMKWRHSPCVCPPSRLLVP